MLYTFWINMEIDWIEIIVVFASGFICVAAYVKWIFNYWERRNVPYLKPSIPMGNFEAPWSIKKGLNETMADIYREFKTKGYKHCGIFTSFRPVYVPLDLDVLKQILIKDFQHFIDRGLYYNEKSDPLSTHLLRLDGDKWRNMRVGLSPTFTLCKMKAMFKLMLHCGDGLKNDVNKLLESNQPVDIKEVVTLFTTNVISTCAFGIDTDCFENPNNAFKYHIRRFFDGSTPSFLRGFIILNFPKLCKMLRVRLLPKDTTKFYSDVFKSIIDHREWNNVNRNDFVQLLLDLKNGNKKNNPTITFKEIAAQAFMFFLAGLENASVTMTFAFYEMARNQDIQDKVRNEIHKVLENFEGKITYEAINEMTYMSQVFDETLRKYPILGTLERVCTKTYEVPGENLVLKKGQNILISLCGIHHDPEYYPNPEKFDPERFTPEKKASRHVCAYMPFGQGPRTCIGKRFAMMQAKIGMAILLKDYKYFLNAPAKLRLHNNTLLLTPVDKVILDIKKID